MKNKNEDKPIKSVVKSISWRVIATFITIILVYIFTRKITIALSIGFLEFSTKLLFFYLHERIWNKIKWGKYNEKRKSRTYD